MVSSAVHYSVRLYSTVSTVQHTTESNTTMSSPPQSQTRQCPAYQRVRLDNVQPTTESNLTMSIIPQSQTLVCSAPQSQTLVWSVPQSQTLVCSEPQSQTLVYSAPQSQSLVYSAPQSQTPQCPCSTPHSQILQYIYRAHYSARHEGVFNVLAFFCVLYKRTWRSLRSFAFFIKSVAFFVFFCVLYKRMQRSLRSFAFFIKECSVLCVLCVLLRSL